MTTYFSANYSCMAVRIAGYLPIEIRLKIRLLEVKNGFWCGFAKTYSVTRNLVRVMVL